MNERPVSAATKKRGTWGLIVERARKLVGNIKSEQARRAAAEQAVERMAHRAHLSQTRASHFERIVRRRRIKREMEKRSRKINRRSAR